MLHFELEFGHVPWQSTQADFEKAPQELEIPITTLGDHSNDYANSKPVPAATQN